MASVFSVFILKRKRELIFAAAPAAKSDIFNSNEKTFLEIKPISVRGVISGPLKFLIDYGAFPKYSPDVKWQPRYLILITSKTAKLNFL
jgi:hypothetical protein